MGSASKAEIADTGIDTSDLKPGMRPAPSDVSHDDGIIEAWDGLARRTLTLLFPQLAQQQCSPFRRQVTQACLRSAHR